MLRCTHARVNFGSTDTARYREDSALWASCFSISSRASFSSRVASGFKLFGRFLRALTEEMSGLMPLRAIIEKLDLEDNGM
jgi:hypothetical protein